MSDDIYEIQIADAQGNSKRCRYTENPDEVLPPMKPGFVADDTVTENLSQPVSRTQHQLSNSNIKGKPLEHDHKATVASIGTGATSPIKINQASQLGDQ